MEMLCSYSSWNLFLNSFTSTPLLLFCKFFCSFFEIRTFIFSSIYGDLIIIYYCLPNCCSWIPVVLNIVFLITVAFYICKIHPVWAFSKFCNPICFFIFRTRLSPLLQFFLLGSSIGYDKGFINLTGRDSCNLSNFFSISLQNNSPIWPSVRLRQSFTGTDNVSLTASTLVAFLRKFWNSLIVNIYYYYCYISTWLFSIDSQVGFHERFQNNI